MSPRTNRTMELNLMSSIQKMLLIETRKQGNQGFFIMILCKLKGVGSEVKPNKAIKNSLISLLFIPHIMNPTSSTLKIEEDNFLPHNS